MKNTNVYRKLLAISVGAGFMAAGSVHAALPAEATNAIKDIGTSATSMESSVWPIIASVAGALVIIKLFKRFIGKV